MKKLGSLKSFAAHLALASVLLVLAGCGFGVSTGTALQMDVPVKDVEIIGPVYVKCLDGEPVYQALLRAAEQKGGNGIVNVMIDVEYSANARFGSALAVKYTNTNAPASSANANQNQTVILNTPR